MLSGTILLASSYGPTSLAIHTATRSRWNHCGLLLFLGPDSHLAPPETGTPLVLESVFSSGAIFTPLSAFLARYSRVDSVTPETPLSPEALAFAVRSYAGSGFPGFPYVSARRGRLNCAHLVSSVYSDMGLMPLVVSGPGALAADRLPFPAEQKTIMMHPADYLGAVALPLLLVALCFVITCMLSCAASPAYPWG